MPDDVNLGNGRDTTTERSEGCEEFEQAFWGDAVTECGTQEIGPALRPAPLCKALGEALTTAPVLRRVAAGLIDRLLPLPFLVPVFWPWAVAVAAYDLGRDASGASVGKRLLGLKTVIVSPDPALHGHPCSAGRSLLRNLLWVGTRLCYFSVVGAPIGLALDVTGCLMAALAPEGRHLGDRLGGTRVVLANGAGGTN